jgi:hypothetical protein
LVQMGQRAWEREMRGRGKGARGGARGGSAVNGPSCKDHIKDYLWLGSQGKFEWSPAELGHCQGNITWSESW